MKIAIAQMNPLVGAVETNAQRALLICERARALGAKFIIFPELYLTGYPPRDLLLRRDFLDLVTTQARRFAKETPLPTLMGAPWPDDASKSCFNAALWCLGGQLSLAAKKRLLPTYNIFDEKRYFTAPQSKACDFLEFEGRRFLISICEDVWNTLPDLTPTSYHFDPVALGFDQSKPIDYLINLSASPYTSNKPHIRERIFTHIARTYRTPVLVASQVGGNDQLLFDGHSLLIDAQGDLKARSKPCQEDLLLFDPAIKPRHVAKSLPDPLTLTREALVMGIRDYVEKCGAKGLIIGLSGGIDSAVCAALAVKALGPNRVRAFFLPSQFSSQQSLNDAQLLAHNLGLNLEIVPIEPVVQAARESLASFFDQARETNRDLGDQNIQARIRGLLLMGISNATDYFMVATSNKSELAVGYGTIYGDMCGAFSPLGDVYKTEVWRLAESLNLDSQVIPESVINRLPTAELRPNQLDTDSLPDYALLDQILRRYIDLDLSPDAIQSETGLDIELIHRVITMVNISEYKRRQAPLALMVSDRVFGEARRLPIAKRLSPYN